MVKLPEEVSIDTEVIDGKTVVKYRYADGSYGIDTKDGGVEVHSPDNTVRVFARLPDAKNSQKEADEYYLEVEKLANGEERSWVIDSGERYIKSENIPGEVSRTYVLNHSYDSSGKLIPGSQYNCLFKEEFANGNEVEYYKDKFIQVKKYEKVDGVIRTYYKNGNMESETLPDKTKRFWNEDGNKKEEIMSNGDYVVYYPQGNIKEKSIEGILTTYYENGTEKLERFPDGRMKCWRESGTLKIERDSNSTKYYGISGDYVSGGFRRPVRYTNLYSYLERGFRKWQ